MGHTEVVVAGPREESGQGQTPVGQVKLKVLLMGDAKCDTMKGGPFQLHIWPEQQLREGVCMRARQQEREEEEGLE